MPFIIIVLSIIIISFIAYNINNKTKQSNLYEDDEYISESNSSNSLIEEFFKKFGVPFLFSHNCEITHSSVKSDKNYFTLSFPYWEHENSNHTQNKRFSENKIIFRPSILYFEEYIISSNDFMIIVRTVNFLRNHNYEIEKNEYEAISGNNSSTNLFGSVSSIIKSYENSPYEFEEFCANLFRAMGYSAHTTPKTNDSGYDIIYKSKDNKTGIAECKCYAPNNIIGRPLIQKLVGANATAKADIITFITTSDFSHQAVEYAKQTGVELINGNSLIKHIDKYINNSNDIDNTITDITIDDFRDNLPSDIFELYKSDNNFYMTYIRNSQ